MKNLKKGVLALLLLTLAFPYAQEKIKLNHDHSKMEMKQTPLEFSNENMANVYEH